MKRTLIAGFLAVVVSSGAPFAYASEITQVKIESIKSASVFMAPQGCVTKAQHTIGGLKYWMDTDKTVDCYGILLREVAGKDNFGNPATYEAVSLFPIPEQSQAESISELIALSLGINGAHPRENVSIDLSNLKISSKKFALSELTKDQGDKVMVQTGGLAVQCAIKDGGDTQTRSYSLGIE